MPEIQERNTELEIAMPRREFIRKSLIASGGLFVGLTTLGNVSLAELSSSKKPKKPSSGKHDDDDNDKDDNDDKGGKPGWSQSW